MPGTGYQMPILFFAALGLLGYTYVGYPLLMRMASRGRQAPNPPPPGLAVGLPRVTVIVPAYNEAAAIGSKVSHVLDLDYPEDRLELIIVSDASSDATDEIVRSYRDARLRLVRMPQRSGKVAAARAGVEKATGSILVISDATGRLDRNGLRALASRFADSDVGAVTGRVVFESPQSLAIGEGERTYWSYNIGLLRAESELASVTSLSGTYFAVRTELYPADMPDDLAEDLVIPMVVVEQGKRAVLEPAAVCVEETVSDEGQELRKRARITLQNIRGLVWGRRMLNPFRYGRFALLLISHKVLRVLSPILLVVLVVTSAVLWRDHWFYAAAAIGQGAFYAIGALAGLFRLRSVAVVNAIHFFCLSNLGVALGIAHAIGGRRVATWDTERPTVSR